MAVEKCEYNIFVVNEFDSETIKKYWNLQRDLNNGGGCGVDLKEVSEPDYFGNVPIKNFNPDFTSIVDDIANNAIQNQK